MFTYDSEIKDSAYSEGCWNSIQVFAGDYEDKQVEANIAKIQYVEGCDIIF